MTNFEEWRDIEGFEGIYQVSNMGRVKSLDRVVNSKLNPQGLIPRKGKILKPYGTSWKYLLVCLSNGDVCKRACVHRLVAENFIPNPDNLPQVNHKNGIKTDNRVSNLEWVSISQNVKHAYDTGLTKKRFGVKHPMARSVNQYSKQGEFIKTWSFIGEAVNALNCNGNGISLCCRGKRRSAGGYVWRYADEH